MLRTCEVLVGIRLNGLAVQDREAVLQMGLDGSGCAEAFQGLQVRRVGGQEQGTAGVAFCEESWYITHSGWLEKLRIADMACKSQVYIN